MPIILKECHQKLRSVVSGPRPKWRPGIGLQLAVAFGLVAVLAVAAFFAAKRTVLVTVTRVSPGAALQVSRAVPLPAPSALEIAAGSEALAALDQLTQLAEASTLTSGAAQVHQARATARELSSAIDRLYGPDSGRASKVSDPAIAVLDIAAKRRLAYDRYSATLERVDNRLKAALDGAWKILGRVVARQSLVALDRRFDDFRRDADRLRSGGYSQVDVDQWRASAQELSSAVTANARAVKRSEGEAWYTATVTDLADIDMVREQLLRFDAQRLASLAAFRTEAQALRHLLREPRMASPARAEAMVAAAEATALPASALISQREQHDGLKITGFAALTVAVLLLLIAVSVFTALSIVKPVHRLVTATRRISRGEAHVRVARGGTRELDGLAVSFNEMAAQLQEAQAIARGAHDRLEARIGERTNQLRHQAEHDALTHLPNRRLLFNRLRDAVAGAGAAGSGIGVFFVDLDNFKTINDGMGHTLGDTVLVAVATRLLETTGEKGWAARFGGDEFVVVVDALPDADALVRLGQALVKAFEAPLQLGGSELLVSVSVGAAAHPVHAADAESLLRASDAAMFRAKALGRKQLCVFTTDLLQAAAARFSIEQGLRLAIERGELELVFQPEINLATLEIDLVEALLRWRLPTGRLATPDEFLAVAEESGLMREINDWVLRTAISAAATWRSQGLANLRVSVNVSARDLSDVELPGRIESMLRDHALPAAALEIELTETVLQTGPTTLDAVRLLREKGISIALDDFGTGYSTLASLEQLPLTRVKLDRSLIAGVDGSPRSIAIARAIIALCRDLGLQITAEGVERPAQIAFLREYSLHLQGYLISRPVSADLLHETLRVVPARLQAGLLAAEAPGSRDLSNPVRLVMASSRSG